ncbi:hypothetical protein RIF29_00872 [Crotalaria pallida]|uniref:Uncharacterized protein n=1 Tax=Crotalaria pallida TaxID=3830 RepID=A0AAN9IX39_CROPI
MTILAATPFLYSTSSLDLSRSLSLPNHHRRRPSCGHAPSSSSFDSLLCFALILGPLLSLLSQNHSPASATASPSIQGFIALHLPSLSEPLSFEIHIVLLAYIIMKSRDTNISVSASLANNL